MAVRRFTSDPIPIPRGVSAASLERADIVVDGLDQAGPSFEARVFVDNADADELTPLTAGSGYEGSIHVYGYGQLPDDPAAPVQEAGPRAPRAPMRRALPATEALRDAVSRGNPVVVTVVAVPYQGPAEDLDVDLSPLSVSLEINQPPTEA